MGQRQRRLPPPLRKSTVPPAPLPSVQVMFAQASQAQQKGDLATAATTYRAILARDPWHADSLHYLGTIFYQQGKLEEAAEMMARSIALDGSRASFYSNFGLVLHAQGKLDEAVAAYHQAIALQSDYPEALNNLGNVLQQQKNLEGAAALYARALALRPEYADALSNLGTVLKAQGLLPQAIEHYRKALALSPNYVSAMANLANALSAGNEFEEAIPHYRRALALQPNSLPVCVNWANALIGQGKVEAAMPLYQRAIAIGTNEGLARSSPGTPAPGAPEFVVAHANLGMALLLLGNFPDGLPLYEWRHRDTGFFGTARLAQPAWAGQPLEGAAILLHAEQGLGDSLQFLRYVPMVQQAGGRVILQVQASLRTLAEQLAGVTVVCPGDPLPSFETRCSLMSLSLAFGTTVDTIPARVPYLSIPGDDLQRASVRGWPETGLRVGLVWAGSPNHLKDRDRSFTFPQVEPLLSLEGVHFHSLQLGPSTAQLPPTESRLADLNLVPGNMADTAAKIAHLDLVIAADTSVAHLAGALGVRTWVMLPFAPDWRWLLQREDSPWYPTMRLFRQPQAGDWKAVIERVREALLDLRFEPSARLVSRQVPPLSPA